MHQKFDPLHNPTQLRYLINAGRDFTMEEGGSEKHMSKDELLELVKDGVAGVARDGTLFQNTGQKWVVLREDTTWEAIICRFTSPPLSEVVPAWQKWVDDGVAVMRAEAEAREQAEKKPKR